jgi:nitrogen fixation protein FixH
MMKAASKAFTGKRMAAVLVGGFGVVIAVNLLMASLAVGSFHGTVVDNSYVASQKYNGWLRQAAASEALGWKAQARRRADGRVVITTRGVPEGAAIAATAERPLGPREETDLSFTTLGEGVWVSDQPLAAGRWQVRIAIRAADKAWAGEDEIR